METILEWHSPEHHFDRKANDWYWILGIVCVATAVLAFYFDNFLFGIFVIIAGLTVGMLSYRETKVVQIQLTTKGIVFGKRLYPWLAYRSFWIEDDHVHGPRILMHPTSSIATMASIPINDEVDLNDIQEILVQFLEEEFLQESIVHKWFDKLLARW